MQWNFIQLRDIAVAAIVDDIPNILNKIGNALQIYFNDNYSTVSVTKMLSLLLVVRSKFNTGVCVL